jgi:type IV pilus assembly protein PilX
MCGSHSQRGAALVIGLVLLLALTLLGIAGVDTAALELRMTGNEQAQQLAFQAAETGLEVALSRRLDASYPARYVDIPVGDGSATFTVQLSFAGITPVPPGPDATDPAAEAVHFDIVAQGTHPARHASVTLLQSVYVVTPAAAADAAFDCDGSRCLQQGAARLLVRTGWSQSGID